MFDVSWTDPTRETVGQRKTRKNLEAKGLPRQSSIHSTRSSEALSVQTKTSLLNVFGGKKQTLSQTRSHSKPTSSCAEDDIEASIGTSSYITPSEGSAHELFSTTSEYHVNEYLTEELHISDAEQSSLSETDESIFSGWTGRLRKTDSIWTTAESTTSSERIIQPLGPRSYVTRSTEITISPRESVDASEHIAPIVHISAAKPIPNRDSESPTGASPSPTFDCPAPTCAQNDRIIPNSVLNQKKHPNFQPTGWPFSERGKLNSWKPPVAWHCPHDEPETSEITPWKSLELPFQLEEKGAGVAKLQEFPLMEVNYLQRSIGIMEAASPNIVLQRLKEEWVGADASVSLRLELEKQFWMLSALRLQSASSSDPRSADPLVSKHTKALSLYENYAFSSFLSVLTRATELHHLSTTPLSPESYPNVYPLSIPSPSPRLPYATGIFTDIHAFPLPALLSASLIPNLLKECRRTLTSSVLPSLTYPEPLSTSKNTKPPPTVKGGILHLTIINPGPLPNTLGPRLRDWLDNHLILNLERQFRCINPARLFPIWLADNGLRGEGSTLSSTKFFACVSPKLPPSPRLGSSGMGSRKAGSGKAGNGKAGSEVDRDEATNEELKSVVGRMLWKEMWGSYVEGDWWWDDESVVDECERMGTCWEYVIIEAVKED